MKPVRFILLALLLLASKAYAQTIVLVSDLNGRYGSAEYHKRIPVAMEAIVGLEPDAVISVGDMVAGQRKPLLDGPHIDRMWRAFNHTVADPLAATGIPLAVTPGNHDGSGFHEFELERRHFEEQWKNRGERLDILPGSEWPRRYAARLDGVLLLAFDGTMPGKLPTTEIEFLEGMLSRYAEAEKITIAFSHLPMWPLATGREKEILDDPGLLDLLHRYDVDIYASGHHHLYHAGTDDAGMLHLAVGALGGNVRSFSGEAVKQRHSFVVLELDGAVPEIRAMSAPDFTQPLDPADLPVRIEGSMGTLERLQARGIQED